MKELNIEDIKQIKINTPEGILDHSARTARSEEIHEKILEKGIGAIELVKNLDENIKMFEIMIQQAKKENDEKRIDFLKNQLEKMKNELFKIIISN